jgi:anti-anti-sigma factor
VTAYHSEDGDEVIVAVAGRFDYRVYDSFKASYASVKQDSQIKVDLSETDYMDSSALGMLLMLREHVGKAARILLVNPTPDVHRVLSIANFDKLFAIER